MPSNPGQSLHIVLSQIHAVASSSHLANLSSQLVVLSSYLVESSSHLVASSYILLTSPLLVYSSVILQLVMSPFNSSCRTSTCRSLYPYILVSVISHIFILSLWLFLNNLHNHWSFWSIWSSDWILVYNKVKGKAVDTFSYIWEYWWNKINLITYIWLSSSLSDTLVKSTFFKSYSVIRLRIVLLDTPKICPIFAIENW